MILHHRAHSQELSAFQLIQLVSQTVEGDQERLDDIYQVLASPTTDDERLDALCDSLGLIVFSQ